MLETAFTSKIEDKNGAYIVKNEVHLIEIQHIQFNPIPLTDKTTTWQSGKVDGNSGLTHYGIT